MVQKAIPVTILTGFLGSGKTSLINHILSQKANSKIAIIENEFGEVNIDGKLIKQGSNNSLFELSNGCICCTINRELGTSLNSMILSRVPYDHLLIEATGIADPKDIIKTFISGERVKRYFRLDAVVCLIDAANFMSQVDDFEEMHWQVTQADLAIVNKIDLIDDAVLGKVEKRLKQIKPGLQTVRAKHAQVALDKVLSISAFSQKQLKKELVDFSSLLIAAPKVGDGKRGHGIVQTYYESENKLDSKKFSDWLERFMLLNKGNILRIKGILYFHDVDKEIVLQIVGDQVDIEHHKLKDRGTGKSQIVFIAKNIDKEGLSNQLEALTI